MQRTLTLNHEFVHFIPEELESGTLYISMEFGTASHKCCCGCGRRVVTPITPTDWELVYDGDSISLSPSIGNWSFPCRSHYWIKKNTVRWAGDMTQKQIEAIRAQDRLAKNAYYSKGNQPSKTIPQRQGVWSKLRKRIIGR